MILKTINNARNYAAQVASIKQLPVHIFQVPPGTSAHDMGYRFGTCSDDERAHYERDGAKIIETVQPVQPCGPSDPLERQARKS